MGPPGGGFGGNAAPSNAPNRPPPQQGNFPGQQGGWAPPPQQQQGGQGGGDPGGPLVVFFQDRRYVVNIDRFIIGRGKNTANLVIDDPNVSRQHLVIERAGNQFFLVDSGSTNGVFCNGQRVVRKQANEGDIVEIAGHQMRLTYRG